MSIDDQQGTALEYPSTGAFSFRKIERACLSTALPTVVCGEELSGTVMVAIELMLPGAHRVLPGSYRSELRKPLRRIYRQIPAQLAGSEAESCIKGGRSVVLRENL